MKACDVLVLGAGPAGCAAAVRAAHAGIATVLVDRPRPARTWAGESLPPGMAGLVRSVFGAECLAEDRHLTAFGSRSAWGNDSLVETDFLANPLGGGWLLDRARFDADARAAAAAAGVTVIDAPRIVSLLREGSAWRIDIGDGKRLAAGFLIDATGRSGALRRHLGIRRIAADRQVAFIATCPDDGDAYRGTTVEAAADGWWYTTPLPGGRRVVAYLTDHDVWRERPRNWHARLSATRHIRRCAGPAAMGATPGAWPSGIAYADRILGAHWLAVGDAAASFDPLSSQGLATAILMGARAADAIAHPDRTDAITAWADAYAMLVAEHADLRTHYARLEPRWPDSIFWRRRREPDAAVMGPPGAWVAPAATPTP